MTQVGILGTPSPPPITEGESCTQEIARGQFFSPTVFKRILGRREKGKWKWKCFLPHNSTVSRRGRWELRPRLGPGRWMSQWQGWPGPRRQRELASGRGGGGQELSAGPCLLRPVRGVTFQLAASLACKAFILLMQTSSGVHPASTTAPPPFPPLSLPPAALWKESQNQRHTDPQEGVLAVAVLAECPPETRSSSPPPRASTS